MEEVSPFEVRTVETGKMSETIPYETEKQEEQRISTRRRSLVARGGVTEGR